MAPGRTGHHAPDDREGIVMSCTIACDYCGEAGHREWIHEPEDSDVCPGLAVAPASAHGDCVPVSLGDWLCDTECACPFSDHDDVLPLRWLGDLCPNCGYVAADPLVTVARELEARQQRELAKSAGVGTSTREVDGSSTWSTPPASASTIRSTAPAAVSTPTPASRSA